MSEDFGNSWNHVKKALLLGGALGSVVMVAMPLAVWQDGRQISCGHALAGGLIVAMAAPLCVVLTTLFSIRVEDGLISQRLLRFWDLRQGRVEDLARVELGFGAAAARLHFMNGACVSLPVADARELQALCVCLLKNRPDFGNYVFGPRAARIEKVIQSFRAAAAHTPQPAQQRRHDRAEPGVATRAIPWGGLRRTRTA